MNRENHNSSPKTIEVTGLFIYPVKSLRGISLSHSVLQPGGLPYDRHWVITDDNFQFITQRRYPAMATIETLLESDFLTLKTESSRPLQIPLQREAGTVFSLKIWDDNCQAFDEGSEASDWLSTVLKTERPLHLLRFAPGTVRPVTSSFLQNESSETQFADAFPYLVTVEESLQALNARLLENGASAVPMNRFRPNIVIRGLPAFSENTPLDLVEISDRFRLGLRKPCQRCVITSIDQNSGIAGEPKEPLRTLLSFNLPGAEVSAVFGQNTILKHPATAGIKNGDLLRAEFL